MKFLFRIVYLVAALALTPFAPALSQTTEPAAVQGLNPGDVLKIVVLRREEFRS